MVFYRFTREAGLLEFSPEYMRAYTGELEMSTEWCLRLVMDILSPLNITVAGSTRSGGFMRSFLLDTNTNYIRWLVTPALPLVVIHSALKLRGVGVLKHDGFVPSISERVNDASCSMVSLNPSFSGTTITMPLVVRGKYLFGRLSGFKIEGDNKRLELILSLVRKATERPAFSFFGETPSRAVSPNITVRILSHEFAREVDTRWLIEELERKKRRARRVGFVISLNGKDYVFYRGPRAVAEKTIKEAKRIVRPFWKAEAKLYEAPLDYEVHRDNIRKRIVVQEVTVSFTKNPNLYLQH